MTINNLPVVAVITDQMSQDGVLLNIVRSRYCEALRETACVSPLLLPTGGEAKMVKEVIKRVDGLLLTGSLSHVLQDKERDSLAFFAIEYCLLFGKPLLGICRGLQEINVFFGGTLHQDLGALKGYLTHSEDETQPRDQQYNPVHLVRKSPEGTLFTLDEIAVNSLHHQGIDQLGKGLTVEGRSSDGLIEAISITQANAWSFSVQWHPEWHHKTDPTSKALFQAFGKACTV